MTNVTPILSAIESGDFQQAEAIITAPTKDLVALDEQACSTYSVTNAARAPIKTVW
jgi:hypothetical protein